MLSRAMMASLLAGLSALALTHPPAPTIAPNDNRHAGGALRNGVLTIRLEARQGNWQPDGPDGPTISTAAFGEVGKSLQTPGPLLRVARGTEIHATVTNRLTKPMWLYGLGAVRGMTHDSVAIAPGGSREMRFRADEAGTFYYAARTDTFPVIARLSEDTQLGGAIIVDEPGAHAANRDRVFVITGWATLDPTTTSHLGPNATLAFNGLSWPATERLTYAEGDSVHFRVVNISGLPHPLHLHGFYFNVDARGDGQRDTTFAPADQRQVVTELLNPNETMAMTWVPNRAGNWIFHCHLAGHIATREALEADRADMTPRFGHLAMHSHMGGLVIGMTVTPRAGEVAAREMTARPIRLIVRSHAAVYGRNVGYSFVLGGSSAEANPDSMPVPGPLLELTRGERVAITIVNQSHDEAAVHWHGIELESYADGVPGWSGRGGTTLPMIPPGDSLTVRFTPPRAGTFMYHSHSNEFQQISSGLYGALIVNEPGARRDTTVDRVLIFGDAGPVLNVVDPPAWPPALLNGQLTPSALRLRSAVPTRLRIINIRTDFVMAISLTEGDSIAHWRVVAKDGMPVPVARVATSVARMVISPGETYDVIVEPRTGASLALHYQLAGFPPELAKPTVVAVQVH